MILVLAVFSVILGAASAKPEIRSWSLNYVDLAAKEPTNKNAPKGLKSMGEQIRAGMYPGLIENLSVRDPLGKDTWSPRQLQTELDKLNRGDPSKSTILKSLLTFAMIFASWNKKPRVYLQSPKKRIQTWEMEDLDAYLAKNSPKRPLYKQVQEARDKLQKAIDSGKKWEDIGLIIDREEYYQDNISSEEEEEEVGSYEGLYYDPML